MTFDQLQLAPAIVQAVHEIGYQTPTPIQQQAIPLILAGHDLLGGAQTGTGKTAAFTLPMLHILSSRTAAQTGAIRALVLCPTRELAAQVQESVRDYGKHLGMRSAVVFGGVGMAAQVQRLRQGVDILVATPGRLLDLQEQGALDMSHVEILVLDEADRMLDMGFIRDVRRVLDLLPQQKQSLLFSATFSDEIRELAASLLRDPQQVQVTPKNTTVQRIAQTIYPVGRNKKKELLLHIIEKNSWNQVLVFTRTKFGANQVAEFLKQNGVTAMALHGNKSQTARTQALADFKSGALRALVATDIAARGIDIDELPHVVNYEIPNVPEDYVHRIGRTGRAGSEGQAFSFVCMDEEGFMHAIEKFTRQQIPVEVVEGFGPEEGEKAEPIAMGRQTLWGGAGKPPSREVMQAAARAARQEMMRRMREQRSKTGNKNKASSKSPNKAPRKAAADANAHAVAEAQNAQDMQNAAGEEMRPMDAEGNPLPRTVYQPRSRQRRNRFRSGGGGQRSEAAKQQGESASETQRTESSGNKTHARSANARSGNNRSGNKNNSKVGSKASGKANSRQGGNRNRYASEDAQPRSHESALFKTDSSRFATPRSKGNSGQPDPLRTSVDGIRRSSRNGGGGRGYNSWS